MFDFSPNKIDLLKMMMSGEWGGMGQSSQPSPQPSISMPSMTSPSLAAPSLGGAPIGMDMNSMTSPAAMSPAVSSAFPALLKERGEYKPPSYLQNPINPWDEGSAAAMKAAKRSIALNEEEKNRAAGEFWMKFGTGLMKGSGKNYNTGFLGGVAEALEPAFEAEKVERQRIEDLNKALALDYAERAQKHRDSLQKSHEHHEDKNLEIQKQNQQALWKQFEHENPSAYEKAVLEINRGKNDIALRKLTPGTAEFQSEYLNQLPVLPTAQSKTKYVTERQKIGKSLLHINELEKKLEEYKDLTKGSNFDPLSPYTSKIATKGKNILGWFGSQVLPEDSNAGKEAVQLEKERQARSNLSSQLEQDVLAIEKDLKGGVLTGNFINRLEDKSVFPNLNEGYEVTRQKLAHMKNDLKTAYDAADLSLRAGRAVSPLDVKYLRNNKEMPSYGNQELGQFGSMSQPMVLMRDKSTGITERIKPQDVEALQAAGFEVVDNG